VTVSVAAARNRSNRIIIFGIYCIPQLGKIIHRHSSYTADKHFPLFYVGRHRMAQEADISFST
jgi:hypothetical protein